MDALRQALSLVVVLAACGVIGSAAVLMINALIPGHKAAARQKRLLKIGLGFWLCGLLIAMLFLIDIYA